MSEPKLCPLQIVDTGRTRNTVGPPVKELMECAQEKCAWWVEARQVSKTYDPAIKMTKDGLLIIEGHCVALDWRNT